MPKSEQEMPEDLAVDARLDSVRKIAEVEQKQQAQAEELQDASKKHLEVLEISAKAEEVGAKAKIAYIRKAAAGMSSSSSLPAGAGAEGSFGNIFESTDAQEVFKGSIFEDLVDPSAVSAEDNALAEEILALLTTSQNSLLLEGQKHIQAANFKEAQQCFEAVVQAPGSLSPEELAKTKLLLVYTHCKIAINCLKDRSFGKAAEIFGKALKQRPGKLSSERLQKLQLFHACALYEAGKQQRKDGDWGAAKKSFEAAERAECLPNDLQRKTLRYIQECKQRSKAFRKQAKLEGMTPRKTEMIDFEENANGLKQAVDLYKTAKRALKEANLNRSKELFEEARERKDLPEALYDRAIEYSDMIDELEADGATKTASVFSDNCTHLLGSSHLTLGFSKETLGLPTTTASLSISSRKDKDMVMVLNEMFPAGSAERKKLIIQLTTDVRKALSTISKAAEIDIRDVAPGSIIVHFRFVNDKAGYLEEEYLKQLDDRSSALYQGKVTCCIDQKRTQTMTMELSTRHLSQTPCQYQPGDNITLAQVHEETISCQVKSVLGEGATATVFKVTTSGKVCALKVFKAENSLEDLCTEASLMLTANHPHSHPNVLRADFVWYEQRTHELFFLLDFVDGEDLQVWMDDERLYAGTEQEQQKTLDTIIHGLIRGLRHLHWLGILHQDNKPENILMTQAGRPLLADLGVANHGVVQGGRVRATLRGGTPVYASPNVRQLFFQVKALPQTERANFLQQHPITHLDDFFALGATILDMYAKCGWRRGQSVAEVLVTAGGVAQLVQDFWMRVAVPNDVLEVLRMCFGADESLTIESIVEVKSTTSNAPPVDEVGGMAAQRHVNIRNNLGVALFDSAVRKQERGQEDAATRCFDAARSELERAIAVHADDACALNNLGVVKWAQGEAGGAKGYFDHALEADPDHAAATFNVSLLQSDRDWTTALIDSSGAAGAVEGNGGKVELTSAVSFAPGQQLEVHRHGKWGRTDVGSLGKPLVELTYRLPVPQVGPKYTADQLLMVHADGEWRYKQAQQHPAPLNPNNHAPALFTDLTALRRAQQAYTIERKEKDAFILDLFSGQKLNTRTQTAMLHLHREAAHAAQMLGKDQDVDSEEWQSERKASVMDQSDSVKATAFLHEMLGGDRAVVRLRRALLLILGPAASGKTTLLKTFAMEMLYCYSDFVPLLMPIIDVLPVLDASTCNRDEGESVVAAFIQRKYPQHAHLLLQMMLTRRVVFLIDGIDESGAHQKDVQDFITVELLEPG
eukprot:g2476.t1